MLDARLSLVKSLYEPCDLAADIGTDHAYLPAELLREGICRKMILTDLSPDALENARRTIVRLRLSDRAMLRAGFGLEPLTEACGMISITGMGGRTIQEILTRGQDRLRGASLLLSAHTDLPLVRRAVSAVGYHLEQEEPCRCGGRFYLIMLARLGARPLSPQEERLGGPLFSSSSPLLVPWVRRRREVLRVSLSGLRGAAAADPALLCQLEADIAFYDRFLRDHAEP